MLLDLATIEKESLGYLSILDKRGYVETVDQLKDLLKHWKQCYQRSNELSGTDRQGIMDSFNSIKGGITRNEFASKLQFPYNYATFDEVNYLFFRLTHSKMDLEWSEMIMTMVSKTPIFKNIFETREKLNALRPVAETTSYPARFYVLCFAFLLAMDGLYDELIRIIYATQLIVEGKPTPDPLSLANKDIDEIKHGITEIPTLILGVWNEGHNVRNAIAHARFYREQDDMFRFIDVNKKGIVKKDGEKVLNADQLGDLLNRVVVMGNALDLLLIMLEIYNGLIVPPEKLFYPVGYSPK